MSPFTREQLLELLQSNTTLEGIDLSGANLEAINLGGVNLNHANLWGARLTGASLGAHLDTERNTS